MISIVIPLYNKKYSIEFTLKTVFDQSYDKFEVIVVNDGSTDGSVDLVQRISDKRIRIINQENQGVAAARNRGISEAQYNWVALLDADDRWFPSHLEKLVKLKEKYKGRHFFSTSYCINENGLPKDSLSKDYVVQDYFKEFFLRSYLVNSSTAFISKTALNSVGGFNEYLKCGEDIDIWIRLFTRYGLVKTDAITSIYQINAENRAMGRLIPFEHDFGSLIDLKKKRSDERKFYKHYLCSKIKTYIYKKEIVNLIKLLKQQGIELIK